VTDSAGAWLSLELSPGLVHGWLSLPQPDNATHSAQTENTIDALGAKPAEMMFRQRRDFVTTRRMPFSGAVFRAGSPKAAKAL
jgi:hypothetical protein